MSFEENLVKKKTKRGLIYFIVGIIFIISFMINGGYFIPEFPTLMTRENCPDEPGNVCVIFLLVSIPLFFIGIPLFIKGLVTLAKRKKLTNKERIQKSDIEKDEKIKGLETRLEKLEDEKSKSTNDTDSQDNNQQNSKNS